MAWVLDVLDNDDSGEIDFKEFVQGMSKFSSKAEKEEKLRFAFRIYDIDNDGFISNGELFQVIQAQPLTFSLNSRFYFRS